MLLTLTYNRLNLSHKWAFLVVCIYADIQNRATAQFPAELIVRAVELGDLV